jgi:hypothetical protein
LRPIAGVVPAEEMLALPATAAGAGDSFESASPTVDPRRLVSWDADTRALARCVLGSGGGTLPPELPTGWPEPRSLWSWLASPAESAARDPADPLTPLPTGWICDPLIAGAGATRLHALAAEGTAATAAAAARTLAPGAACAVPLVLGDARLGAVGTVSWVDGDRVLMMGHPIFQRGPIDLPLATAEIVTVLPARDLSLKIGSIGPVVGSVLRDQRAGLVGRLGRTPPLVPVDVTVDLAGKTHAYAFTVATDPFLTPNLVFWCLYNALLAEGDDQSRQTLQYELVTEWTRPSGGSLAPVTLSGRVTGPGGAAGLATEWISPLQILMNNRYERLRLARVSARLATSHALRTAYITSLSAPASAVPGDRLAVGIDLQNYRGDEHTETIPLELPSFLPPGRYRLAVASAREFFALEVERAAELFQDYNLASTLELIEMPRSAATLVVALLAPGANPVVAGREFDRLPASIDRALRRPAGGVAATRAIYAARAERATDLVLSGHAIRELVVRPPTKTTPQEARP